MKESIKWIIIALLLAGIILCAYFGYSLLTKDRASGSLVIDAPSEDSADEKENGESSPSANENTAPDFVVYDKDGKAVRLSDFKGTPVIINFWATWCPYCIMEMPDLEAACKAYGDKIQFMIINVTDGYEETLSSAKAFAEEYKYDFPVYYDTSLSATSAYSAYSLPRTFFIDADGNLDSHWVGMITPDILQQGIDRLLK